MIFSQIFEYIYYSGLTRILNKWTILSVIFTPCLSKVDKFTNAFRQPNRKIKNKLVPWWRKRETDLNSFHQFSFYLRLEVCFDDVDENWWKKLRSIRELTTFCLSASVLLSSVGSPDSFQSIRILERFFFLFYKVDRIFISFFCFNFWYRL